MAEMAGDLKSWQWRRKISKCIISVMRPIIAPISALDWLQFHNLNKLTKELDE